ncbi:neuropeptide S receptor-like [Bubalus bubalis]|uniref:neuropeptide S receptor-like n=1 Tax=Bubalus bubalis TaxID=89462 RepID=UPI001D0FCBDE|nr:neuropeptide S receptor-like [Bubalus bubalis]
MPANLTEGSAKSNGTGQALNSPVLCTETVTFTAEVEGEEWGSFYYSFKTEQLITLWVLFVFTIVGNAIVLFSTRRRKRKSRMTFFVTQLAITGKQLQERNELRIPMAPHCQVIYQQNWCITSPKRSCRFGNHFCRDIKLKSEFFFQQI